MLYYFMLILLFVLGFCAVMAAFYVDKTNSRKHKTICLISTIFFIISCLSLIPIYNYDCKTSKLEVKDITVRIHYIDGSTQDYVFKNVRKRYPQVYHYKGDYSITVEEYELIGAYRYDILKEKNHEVTIDEFYRSWNRRK